MIAVGPDAGVRFNPPPTWTVPAGFDPRRGHLADPAWPTAPEGWSFWVTDPTVGREAATRPSAALPRGRLESGERRRLGIALACAAAIAALVFWAASMSDSPEARAGIGSCWTDGSDFVNQVPCGSARAAYVVEREVSRPEQCPPGPAGYLEVGETFLCLRSLD